MMAERSSDANESEASVEDGTAVVYSAADNRADGTGLSVAVIQALAEARSVGIDEIEQPLYDVVDPDALDRLFTERSRADVVGRVVFEIDAYEVTVHSDNDILVRRIDPD